jgi:hypothetical protein
MVLLAMVGGWDGGLKVNDPLPFQTIFVFLCLYILII